jgi:general secretion pathway protein A
MYQGFYKLREMPFRMAPDPRFIFRSEAVNEVLASLKYGIEGGKGLMLVTGDTGTGKTTLLRSVLRALDDSVLVAYIFNPLLTPAEFFDLLSSELKFGPQPSKASMIRALGQLLLARHAQGLRTALIIDEAHLLSPSLFEEVRLLLNYETNQEKLIQIVLCGQKEIELALERPEMRQLKQRVSLRCSIKPFSPRETIEYVRWRLKVAGSPNQDLFEPEALALVHRFSGGIPRLINSICDNALLSGFSQSSPRITAQLVREVAELLSLAPSDAFRPEQDLGRTIFFSAEAEAVPKQAEVPSEKILYMRRERAGEPVPKKDPTSEDFFKKYNLR